MERVMLLEEFIITVYCCIDDQLKREFSATHYRTHGFAPKLSDSEVLTMEIVGEFLGIDQDKHIWNYFSRHWKNWFQIWDIAQPLQGKLQISGELNKYYR